MINCLFKGSCKKFEHNNCQIKYDSDVCIREYKLKHLFEHTLLSTEQFKTISLVVDSDNTDLNSFSRLADIKQNIASFINNGNNLYLYSAIPGNGKTSWAVKLLQSYLYKIWPESRMTCRALFINVPRFLLELKANISTPSDYIQHINKYINDANLVVWDDIGTKAATEFEHEHLLSLIDKRLLDGKSNIFTSNIDPNILSELVGDRLASRIINKSECIIFRGKDKRNFKQPEKRGE